MSHVHAFFMHMYHFCFYYIDIKLFGAFLHVSLSPSLFLALICFIAPKRKSTPSWNPLRFGHLLILHPLILLHLTSDSVMIKPIRTFQRTSHDEAFIRKSKSFYQIFSILTFPLSSTIGIGSHCVASRSLLPPWSYRSFTPICTDSIIQYLILSLAFEVHAS